AVRHRPRARTPRAQAAGRHPQDGARVPQALRLVHQGRRGCGRLARAALPDRFDAAGGSDLRGLSRRKRGGAGGVNLEDLGRFIERLPFASIDHLRPATQGHQEVILCQGKTPEQAVAIAERLEAAAGSFLATRAELAHRAALAGVVGGLVPVPVIAVPTSVGYGASFGGVAALLAMLNSCAAGVTVVNIDNGFGAAAAASRINHS